MNVLRLPSPAPTPKVPSDTKSSPVILPRVIVPVPEADSSTLNRWFPAPWYVGIRHADATNGIERALVNGQRGADRGGRNGNHRHRLGADAQVERDAAGHDTTAAISTAIVGENGHHHGAVKGRGGGGTSILRWPPASCRSARPYPRASQFLPLPVIWAGIRPFTPCRPRRVVPLPMGTLSVTVMVAPTSLASLAIGVAHQLILRRPPLIRLTPAAGTVGTLGHR